MNTITIAEAGQLPSKAVIEKMVVTVKSAFDPKSFPSSISDDEGNPLPDYNVQNVTLSDDTGTIKCAFFDANVNLKNFIGQQIVLMSAGGKGLTRNDYNNKKTGQSEKQLKASKQTIIDEVTGADSGTSAAGATGAVGTVPNVQSANSHGSRINYAPDEDKRQTSFERQKALELAVEFQLYGKGGHEYLLQMAEKFYLFLSGQDPKAEKTAREMTASEYKASLAKPEEETHADEVL